MCFSVLLVLRTDCGSVSLFRGNHALMPELNLKGKEILSINSTFQPIGQLIHFLFQPCFLSCVYVCVCEH